MIEKSVVVVKRFGTFSWSTSLVENSAPGRMIGYVPSMKVPPDEGTQGAPKLQMSKEIAESRRVIDELDHALIDLLARRRRVVKELFVKKQALGLSFVDSEREAQLLDERQKYAQARGVSGALVTAIFRKVLEDSHSIDTGEAGAKND
jgi:chorismate mutase